MRASLAPPTLRLLIATVEMERRWNSVALYSSAQRVLRPLSCDAPRVVSIATLVPCELEARASEPVNSAEKAVSDSRKMLREHLTSQEKTHGVEPNDVVSVVN